MNNKRLVIRDSLLNITVVIHIIIAILVTELVAGMRDSLNASPVLFLYAALAYLIFWVDYKSINIIEFDFQNKNISITNRSVVRRFVTKYILPKPSTYFFKEIGGICMSGHEENRLLPLKHLVNVNLKNGQSIQLIGFSDEINSILFSEFVTVLID